MTKINKFVLKMTHYFLNVCINNHITHTHTHTLSLSLSLNQNN